MPCRRGKGGEALQMGRLSLSLSLYGSSVRGTWKGGSLLGTPKIMKGGL
jgi:hypothetical protein